VERREEGAALLDMCCGSLVMILLLLLLRWNMVRLEMQVDWRLYVSFPYQLVGYRADLRREARRGADMSEPRMKQLIWMT
jgi:hypothetical protein